MGRSLRARHVFGVVRAALARASTTAFRVLHFSVQADHVHLIVEADEPRALVRGLQGLAIRVAKRVNALLGRRGSVWSDRVHTRALTSPPAVRHALVYVLQNWRKHERGTTGRDPRSSGAWFDGWAGCPVAPGRWPAPVVMARTWLARIGWRRHGLVGESEGPARERAHRRR